jgi:hypothetical protein
MVAEPARASAATTAAAKPVRVPRRIRDMRPLSLIARVRQTLSLRRALVGAIAFRRPSPRADCFGERLSRKSGSSGAFNSMPG